MKFFPEMQIDSRAAAAMARGLYALADADGIHEHEIVLITSFWLDAGGTPSALAALQAPPVITPAELASQLHGQEQTQFLKSAILLAWADGEVTPQERKLLDAFAVAFGIAPAALTTLEAEMKAYLLEHLAHLHNTGEFKRVT